MYNGCCIGMFVIKEALPVMMKTLIRVLVVLALLVLLVLLVPSATPLALSEEARPYPTYVPVELEATGVEPISYEEKVPYAPIKENYLPDKAGYLDPTISVRVEYTRAYDTTIQLTWVQIADASQLRAKLANPYPSKSWVRPDVIAKRVSAVLAINDDWFMNRNVGYIVRNGELLRDNPDEGYDVLIIDSDGDFHIIQKPTREKIDSFAGDVIHALSFGPALVVDGVEQTEFESNKGDVLHEIASKKVAQRLAFCQVDKLSYLIIATEGPENKGSVGLTIPQFAEFCGDMGVQQAFNLDGGSSSSVVLNYKKINSLSTGKIRSIGGMLYFVTADPTVPREE